MTNTGNVTKSLASQSHIGCLVLHKVCGSHAKGMQNEVERLLATNGPEWCVRRYKALYTAAIHLKNGDRARAVQVYQQNSISYHRGTCLPKGEWKYAVQQFVNSRRPSVMRRWAAVLRFYTSLTLREPSRAQVKKFHDAMLNPAPLSSEELRKIGYDLAKRVCEDRGFRTQINVDHCVANVRPAALHGTSYYFSDLTKFVKQHLTRDDRDQLNDCLNQPYGKLILSLLTENWIPPALAGLLPMDGVRQSKMRTHHLDSGLNGRVVMLQQQGAKGRTVFQPTAALQLAFLPLHDVCNGISKRLFYFEADWENQVDGVYQALENLSKDLPIYSVDQSSATDRFPRWISEGILDYFGATKYADALEQVCNRKWKCEFLSEPITVKVGQPMGLYGSFPLYNLSNLMVAADAQIDVCRMGHKPTCFPDGTCFKVVGDDIILSDELVANRYREKLEIYGVKISETKSFSGKVGEFAGFLLLPSEEGNSAAFRPYKYPVGDQITNPVDFLHALGVQAAKLSAKWAEHYIAYRETVGQRMLDLSPMVLRLNDDLPQGHHTRNKDSSVVSLAQAISAALCKSYDGMKHAGDKNEQLAAYCRSVYYGTATRWTNEPKAVETERVVWATGSEPEPTHVYDVFSRSDYVRKDNEDRLTGHHLAHKRLRDDPLIPEREANGDLKEKARELFARMTQPVIFGSAGVKASSQPEKQASRGTDPIQGPNPHEESEAEDDLDEV